MYQRIEGQLILPGDFFLFFGGTLAEDNRWVMLLQIVPWWRVEEKYAKNFKRNMKGQKPSRFGSRSVRLLYKNDWDR